MKKILLFIAAIALAATVSSCDKNPDAPKQFLFKAHRQVAYDPNGESPAEFSKKFADLSNYLDSLVPGKEMVIDGKTRGEASAKAITWFMTQMAKIDTAKIKSGYLPTKFFVTYTMLSNSDESDVMQPMEGVIREFGDPSAK